MESIVDMVKMVATIDASFSLMNADSVYGMIAYGQEKYKELGFST